LHLETRHSKSLFPNCRKKKLNCKNVVEFPGKSLKAIPAISTFGGI
jgi:hypothetical protein